MDGHVVILALLSAINPTMLTAVALMMSRPRAKASLIAYLVGGMLVSVTFGVVALAVLHGVDIGGGDGGPKIGPGVEIVVGSISLVMAALLPRILPRVEPVVERRREVRAAKRVEDGPSRLERLLDRSSLPIAFVVGVAFNLPGACYLVSIAELADGSAAFAVWFPLVLLFNVIMFLPTEVPLFFYLTQPDRTQERVESARLWLRRNAFKLARIMFVVVAVYLFASAAIDLL